MPTTGCDCKRVFRVLRPGGNFAAGEPVTTALRRKLGAKKGYCNTVSTKFKCNVAACRSARGQHEAAAADVAREFGQRKLTRARLRGCTALAFAYLSRLVTRTRRTVRVLLGFAY